MAKYYKVRGSITFEVNVEDNECPDEDAAEKYVEEKLCICQHGESLKYIELEDESIDVDEVELEDG